MDTKLLDKAVELSFKYFNLSSKFELVNCSMKSNSIKLKMSNRIIDLDITYPIDIIEDQLYLNSVTDEKKELESEEQDIRNIGDLESKLLALTSSELKYIAEVFDIPIGTKKIFKKGSVVKKILSKGNLLVDIDKFITTLVGGNNNGKEISKED